MKTSNVLLIACLILYGSVSQAIQVPASWYDASAKASSEGEREVEAQFEKEMGRVLKLHTSTLADVSEERARDSKWSLKHFALQFGLTHEGRLGILPFNGTSAAEVILTKGTEKKKTVSEESGLSVDLSDVSLSSNHLSGNQQLNKIMKAVLATGKVKDAAKLRTEVQKTVAEIRRMQHLLVEDPSSSWTVKRLYLDRGITASGYVVPGFATGVEVRLRLSWTPIKSADVSRKPGDELIGSAFRKLIHALGEDLEATVQQNPLPHFQFSSYKFGIGLSAQVGVGMAGFGAKAAVHAEIVRKEAGHIQAVRSLPENTFIWLIEDRVQKINRTEIRKGLRASMRIAHKMLNSANNASIKDWQVSEVRASFDVWAGGKFLLSQIINGKATTEMSFQRTE